MALFVVVAVILIRMDWQLGLIRASFIPVVAVYTGIIRLKMRRIWLLVQEKMAEMSTVVQENFTGVRVVKAFASEPYEERKFEEKNIEVAANYIEAEKLRASSTAFMLFTFLVSVGLIFWLAKASDGRRHDDRPVGPVHLLSAGAPDACKDGGLSRELLRPRGHCRPAAVRDLGCQVASPGSARAVDMPRAKGHVRFDNVSFAYDATHPVLTEITLDAEPGEVVVLLGAPGSGKTSIVNLVPRFYDITGGDLTIDGVDVRDFTLASLRRNIGIVQQTYSCSPRQSKGT